MKEVIFFIISSLMSAGSMLCVDAMTPGYKPQLMWGLGLFVTGIIFIMLNLMFTDELNFKNIKKFFRKFSKEELKNVFFEEI